VIAKVQLTGSKSYNADVNAEESKPHPSPRIPIFHTKVGPSSQVPGPLQVTDICRIIIYGHQLKIFSDDHQTYENM
jgi:hypothetical protein